MRKIARIVGLAWMALTAIGAVFFFGWFASVVDTTDHLRRGYGLLILAFFVALPAIALYRWGRGPYIPPETTQTRVAVIFPPKSARDMGHVMQMKDGPPHA